jgi:hypothetical protein
MRHPDYGPNGLLRQSGAHPSLAKLVANDVEGSACCSTSPVDAAFANCHRASMGTDV